MEVILRCWLPDRPGGLAAITSAIGAAGGDIQAVDVIEHHEDGTALDDLVVVLADDVRLEDVLARVKALESVELVHVGPSRGHPGDGVTRVAIGLEQLLNGAQTPERAAISLVGGLLRAESVEVLDAKPVGDAGATQLVLPFGLRWLVARRAYRFTATERWRATAILSACAAAAQCLE